MRYKKTVFSRVLVVVMTLLLVMPNTFVFAENPDPDGNVPVTVTEEDSALPDAPAKEEAGESPVTQEEGPAVQGQDDQDAREVPAGDSDVTKPDPKDTEEPEQVDSDNNVSEDDDPVKEEGDQNEGKTPENENTDVTDPEEITEETSLYEDAVHYTEKGDLKAADVQGEAAESKAKAKEAFGEETDLSKKDIDEAVVELFAAEGESVEEEGIPHQGDGSTIEEVSVKWVTKDTTDNDDSNLLYVKPSANHSQSVILQINYALSGEHDYAPGDVTITIPASIFKNRSGKDYGTMVIPYPEDPSRKDEFNWKLVGDQYILTNTRKFDAATKGFIQISIENLSPSELVDMQVSEPFDAYIEVVTNKGNTIALRSTELTAQFDTEAKITGATKRTYGSVTRVEASAIPAAQRIEGEEEYIKVDWYVWGQISSNTYYTLDLTDTIPDEYDGFIIGATDEDGRTLTKKSVYKGYANGQSNYYYFSVAYPASQFEPDTEYVFHNTITETVTETDPAAEVTNPNVGDDPKLTTEQNDLFGALKSQKKRIRLNASSSSCAKNDFTS